MQHIAYIGLGSNLGQRRAVPRRRIARACRELQDLPHTRLLCCSPLYRSAPMGPPGQPDYVNAVAQLGTALRPVSLLHALQDLELRHGRVRSADRWGPRTLDLDLLLFDQMVLCSPELILPHPGAHERGFVLLPLLDIAADLRIPGHGTVRALAARCDRYGLTRIAPAPLSAAITSR